MEIFHIMKIIKPPNRMHFQAMADKSPRIQPPLSMSAAGQLVWHQTVDALPSNWFAAGHSAMLPSTAVALCRWLTDPAFWGLVGGITRH
jgi:hypothetical protein